MENARLTHLSIYVTFPSHTALGFISVPLAFSSLQNEETESTKERVSLINFILSLFLGKSTDIIVALVGYNCSTNKYVASLSGVSLVGCASNHFNLGVKDIIFAQRTEIHSVHVVNKKISKPVYCAALCVHTNLASVISNVSRSSSVYVMLQLYQKIKQHLNSLHIAKIDEVLPSAWDDCDINQLFKDLQQLDAETRGLQKEATTFAHVCT